LNGEGRGGSEERGGLEDRGGSNGEGRGRLELRHLLPPERPEERPPPWRILLAFFVPAAALAAGMGIQRAWEGAAPQGDAVLRWLLWSCGAGLLFGAMAGVLRRSWLWALYGAASPFVAAGVVVACVAVVRPIREFVADRREARCRSAGRKLCTDSEFRASCEHGEIEKLGPPSSRICSGASCTSRWLYTGPFRDASAGTGSLLCSMVIESGNVTRTALLPSEDRD
jgi:hypothetical protein